MNISIVIPARNEELFLPHCLISIAKQNKMPFEIIVVDNNSTDGTTQVAHSFGARVIHEKKVGIIPSRNRGFDEATGDIIARCDADAILPPHWVSTISEIFSSKHIDGISGPVEFSDLPLSFTRLTTFYLSSMRMFLGHAIFLGPNFALKKTSWEKIRSLVCTNDREVHEDLDLAIHLHQSGGIIYEDKRLKVLASGRRIKYRPYSFFGEYPIRLFKTVLKHRK